MAGDSSSEGVRYPVDLLVAGRACLVVGGGAVAARKAEGLRDAGASVHLVAERVGPEARALDGITWEERSYRPGEVEACWLVITATDDPAVNRQVAAEATERRIWVNSADDPDNCSFILPAVLRRGDLGVAVSTGGASPAFSAWIRDRLGEQVDDATVALLGIVVEVRDAIRAQGRSTEGLDWRSALDSGMLELVREGHLAEAKERLEACLSSSSV